MIVVYILAYFIQCVLRYSYIVCFPHNCSPYQDDFLILHVREEYDSVLETVLKTEFLTLLSEKFQAITQSKLSFTFNRRSVFSIHVRIILFITLNV